jgi:hypothetical protein
MSLASVAELRLDNFLADLGVGLAVGDDVRVDDQRLRLVDEGRAVGGGCSSLAGLTSASLSFCSSATISPSLGGNRRGQLADLRVGGGLVGGEGSHLPLQLLDRGLGLVRNIGDLQAVDYEGVRHLGFSGLTTLPRLADGAVSGLEIPELELGSHSRSTARACRPQQR